MFAARWLKRRIWSAGILAWAPVTVEAAGFTKFTTTDVTVNVNARQRVDVALQVGAITETVEVPGVAAVLETDSSEHSQVINTRQIVELPLNGRSYIDLLGLQAGVAPASAGTIYEGSSQSARPVSGNLSPGNISVNGQRETANAFLVNGGDVSEGRNLGAGLVPNLDSVQEFRLITNSFDAEYGKFSGAMPSRTLSTRSSARRSRSTGQRPA